MKRQATGHVIPSTAFAVTYWTKDTTPSPNGWNEVSVRKARTKRRAVVETYRRTGKLPPLAPTWKPAPLRPPGFDPAAVVLPAGLKYRPAEKLLAMLQRTRPEFDLTLTDAAERYLNNVSKRVEGRDAWTCGCATRQGWDARIIPCKAHVGALLGRDDVTGEYGD